MVISNKNYYVMIDKIDVQSDPLTENWYYKETVSL